MSLGLLNGLSCSGDGRRGEGEGEGEWRKAKTKLTPGYVRGEGSKMSSACRGT